MPVLGPMYSPAARRKSLAGIAARARAALHRRLAANGREGSHCDTDSPVRGCWSSTKWVAIPTASTYDVVWARYWFPAFFSSRLVRVQPFEFCGGIRTPDGPRHWYTWLVHTTKSAGAKSLKSRTF